MSKINFFHFRGNSERRVHVFLRHLEKMSHQFFEPEMGLSTPPGHFQQKRPKKAKKKFSDSGRKIPFPVPAEEISFAGTGNGIFLPLSEIFLFFFPLYENTVEVVLGLFEAI